MPFKDKKKATEYQKKWHKEHPGCGNRAARKWQRNNHDRAMEASYAWQDANPEKVFAYNLKSKLMKKYGLSVEDWDSMFKNQNGRCVICGRHQSELKRSLCVDHDHKTGKVRGLLCFNCNMAIGFLDDNKQSLKNAISYLEQQD